MKNLEDYFNAAKKTEPMQSLQEIENMISRHRAKQGHSIFNLDNLFYKRKSFIYLSLTFSTMLLAAILSLVMLPFQQEQEQEVFIPSSQQRIMHLVNELNRADQAIKVSQLGQTVFKDTQAVPKHMRSALSLSTETMQLLGITISATEIKYEGNIKGLGFLSFAVTSKHHSGQVDENQHKGFKEYDFYPWFLSDETGKQRVRYQFDNEPPLKMTNAFFTNVMDQLIPIEVRSPGGGNVIFWFSQSDALMQILESAANLTTSPSVNTQNEPKTNSLEIELYPTITTGVVDVNLNALKKQDVEISVLNGSGEVLKVYKNENLKEGGHSLKMDLSEFQKGLYFVRVHSQPGITTIHRIFKN